MPLTMKEEIALQPAFMHISRVRNESLRQMFSGTQLVPKSRLEKVKASAVDAGLKTHKSII
jgi:hypothetical protein